MLKDIRAINTKKTNKINTSTYMWTYRGRNEYGRPGSFQKSKVLNFLVDNGKRFVRAGRPGVHYKINDQGRLELTELGHKFIGGSQARGSVFSLTTIA